MDFRKKIFIVLSVLSVTSGEIIKFEDKNNIFCVTDYANVVIYLEPPIARKTRNSSILIDSDTVWNDWSLKSSKEVIVPPIIDKRWEDLETTYTDSIYLESRSSLSFSIPFGQNISIVVSDPPSVVPSIVPQKARDTLSGWIHYTTYPSDNENATEFIQVQYNITSANETYFRIHDYKLRWADNVSETATVIPVSLNDTTCLMLYVYVGYGSILEVNVTGRSTHVFAGTNQRSLLPWQYTKIELLADVDITLFRKTTNENGEGQWAVDIRQCPPTVANKTIYEVSWDEDVEQGVDRKCTLGWSATKEGNSRQSSSVRTNDDAFSCNPGIVGRECDIQCTELLGSDKKYCEEYQICDNTDPDPKCFCSWGYQGEACATTCSDGVWGLSCQNTCNNLCSNVCNGKTGECNNSSASNFISASGLILLGILFKFLC